MKPNDLVLYLVDDLTENPTWQTTEEAQKAHCIKVLAVGFYVNEDDEEVRISPTIAVDSGRGTIIIPKGTIKRKFKLTIPKFVLKILEKMK